MELLPQAPTHWMTRWWFLRALGFIYLAAFVSLWWQLLPLFGQRGVLPIAAHLDELRTHGLSFWQLPSLLWIASGDGALRAACAVGLGLSVALLAGATNAMIPALLWAIYLSFVNVGQIFYGYGWEILLLEAGFLAIFLCPLRTISPRRGAPPAQVVWLIRWLLFRVMFGAGLIKIRGDACWRDLTCLVYHYETQPIPNPLSWLFHQAPVWFHQAGVLFNHIVELIVPFGLFGPRRVRHIAAALTALFQIILILSGNLSWLNWLTLTLCIACLDDSLLARRPVPDDKPERATQIVGWALVAVVAFLSLGPVANLLSRHQLMNTSFDRLHLVNTYGAFGSVGRVRHEVVLEGSLDGVAWREIEFRCKPGDVSRRPCLISPLQPRLDWQIWFAAMSRAESQAWLFKFVGRLLEGERFPSLLSLDFTPRLVRARLYEYRFTRFGEPGWWTRKFVSEYFPPIDREQLQQIAASDD